jgi:hypothetical protein
MKDTVITATYTFRIRGTVVQGIRSLFPSNNKNQFFNKFYFYNTDNELIIRLINFSG